MTRLLSPLALLAAAALGLSACGSDTDETLSARSFQAVVQSAVRSGRRSGPAAPPEAQLGLTRAILQSNQINASLVTIERAGASALMAPIAANRGIQTWASQDAKTLSFRDGILVATRGLGDDLMTASVPSPAQIAAGGSWNRVHVTLDGEDRPQRHRYSCTAATVGPARIEIVERSYATRLVRETCRGADGGFENEYWFQTGSDLRQSRQWIGRSLGHVAIRRLSE